MVKMSDNPENLGEALPYREAVAALYRSEVVHDADTHAYARLGDDVLYNLAKTGKIKGPGVASIIPDAFEYKLDLTPIEDEDAEDLEYAVDYEEEEEDDEFYDEEEDDDYDEELDDPLREADLKRAIGITKLPFAMRELEKLGMDSKSLSPGEISDLVRYLEDSRANRVDFRGKDRSNYNSFIALAASMDINLASLKAISSEADGRTGFLIGLNEKFLDEAGEDAWPKGKGVRGNNHPCIYSKKFPGLEHITKIIPLDDESKKIMDTLRGLKPGESSVVKNNIRESVKTVRDSVSDLGLDK